MEEMVQRSQPAMRSQDCHPWQRSHIWGLVLASALSRYVTQKQLYPSQPWWIVFNFLKIMPKLFLFHHSNISMAHWTIAGMARRRGWLSKYGLSFLLDYWTLPQLKLPFDEYLHGRQVIFIFITHLKRSTRNFFPNFLLPIFQSYSFQVTDHTWT